MSTDGSDVSHGGNEGIPEGNDVLQDDTEQDISAESMDVLHDVTDEDLDVSPSEGSDVLKELKKYSNCSSLDMTFSIPNICARSVTERQDVVICT